METPLDAAPLKLATVLEICEEVTASLRPLSGAVPTLSQADLNRILSNAADQMALGSSLIRNEYWNQRGLTSYEL